MLNETKQLIADQAFVTEWLERKNETDDLIIKETINLMRTNKEYRSFIVDYVRGEK